MSAEQLYIVRMWDGMDALWINVSNPVPHNEAQRIWNEKTLCGRIKTKFENVDYYKVFEATTRMVLSTEGYLSRGQLPPR